MSQLRTVTIFFDGLSVDITRPLDAEFDDFFHPALNAFKIPIELKEFCQVLSGHQYLYGKEAFNRYVELYPDCDFVFELRMDIEAMNERVSMENGKYVVKPIIPEKRALNFDDRGNEDPSLDRFDCNGPSAKRFKATTEEI